MIQNHTKNNHNDSKPYKNNHARSKTRHIYLYPTPPFVFGLCLANAYFLIVFKTRLSILLGAQTSVFENVLWLSFYKYYKLTYVKPTKIVRF